MVAAQDCSRRYGGEVAIMRIDRLSCDQFIESRVGNLSAGSHVRFGLHTVNRIDDSPMLAVDTNRRVFSRSAFWREVGARAKRTRS